MKKKELLFLYFIATIIHFILMPTIPLIAYLHLDRFVLRVYNIIKSRKVKSGTLINDRALWLRKKGKKRIEAPTARDSQTMRAPRAVASHSSHVVPIPFAISGAIRQSRLRRHRTTPLLDSSDAIRLSQTACAELCP